MVVVMVMVMVMEMVMVMAVVMVMVIGPTIESPDFGLDHEFGLSQYTTN